MTVSCKYVTNLLVLLKGGISWPAETVSQGGLGFLEVFRLVTE
jgi:hypothetical protein